MTWSPAIEKAPPREAEVWDTNERIYAEWLRFVNRRGAKNTQRNLRVYVKVFLQMFSALATTLEREDIENFVARISTKCPKLMNGERPQCLAKEDLRACPLLVPELPTSSCASYRPLDPMGVWSYVCSVNQLYDWLLVEGRVARNPALPVMRDFASRHAGLFEERQRKPRRRFLELEEVRSLVTRTPIHHGIAYLLMAKCFLRIHEVLKLAVDPDHCNVDEGWMDLPSDWDLGNKRLGSKRIILDAEARFWVRRYLAWREVHVKRHPDGTQATNVLLITIFGRPWGEAGKHNLNSALHEDAIRLELMTGKETERWERINSHAFRAFATTKARERGVSIADVQLMRGDKNPGSIGRYDDYQRRLPGLWDSYGPVLGV